MNIFCVWQVGNILNCSWQSGVPYMYNSDVHFFKMNEWMSIQG